MPKDKSQYILDRIVNIVREFSGVPSLEDISQLMIPAVPKRTLQRYLARLTEDKKLSTLGKARATKYCLPHPCYQYPAAPEKLIWSFQEEIAKYNVKDFLIHFSPVATTIKEKLKQPIKSRQAVGYNKEFLFQYLPNVTHYLPEEVRKHLFEVGKSPDFDRSAGTYARHMLNRLLIDLSWNSSRLEGNTYSLLETERLVELGKMSEVKDFTEAQMILNHKAAIEFMVDSADQMKFDNYTIYNLHALLSDNLLTDDKACGTLRTCSIRIGKSVYHPLSIPQLIGECFQHLLKTADAIKDPFEQAFFVMVHLPYLQPFLDVNKRVSRLAANIPLIRENLCPLSFVDVPEQDYISGLLAIYELNRIELLREVFVWAYERSSKLYLETRQEVGEPDLFRLKYRTLLMNTVAEIVRSCMDKQSAVATIRQKASEFTSKDEQPKFIQVVETALMGLHKGNIARFRVRPNEFDLWMKTWY